MKLKWKDKCQLTEEVLTKISDMQNKHHKEH